MRKINPEVQQKISVVVTENLQHRNKYYSQEELNHMTYQELQDLGFIKYTRHRNNIIRGEFLEMVTHGSSVEEAVWQLGEKHFMSHESVRGIIYRKDAP